MPETAARRRPSVPSRTARGRRRLIAGCVVVAAVLGLSACGTASGALQPPAAGTQSPMTGAAQPQQPGGTAAGTIAPAPGSDASTGTRPAASA